MDMFPSLLPQIRDVNIKQRNVLFGVGIVENAFDQTAVIEIIPAEQIADKEPELQRLAKENMPKLNFSNIDVLIIDEMGKNIETMDLEQCRYFNKPYGINKLINIEDIIFSSPQEN